MDGWTVTDFEAAWVLATILMMLYPVADEPWLSESGREICATLANVAAAREPVGQLLANQLKFIVWAPYVDAVPVVQPADYHIPRSWSEVISSSLEKVAALVSDLHNKTGRSGALQLVVQSETVAAIRETALKELNSGWTPLADYPGNELVAGRAEAPRYYRFTAGEHGCLLQYHPSYVFRALDRLVHAGLERLFSLRSVPIPPNGERPSHLGPFVRAMGQLEEVAGAMQQVENHNRAHFVALLQHAADQSNTKRWVREQLEHHKVAQELIDLALVMFADATTIYSVTLRHVKAAVTPDALLRVAQDLNAAEGNAPLGHPSLGIDHKKPLREWIASLRWQHLAYFQNVTNNSIPMLYRLLAGMLVSSRNGAIGGMCVDRGGRWPVVFFDADMTYHPLTCIPLNTSIYPPRPPQRRTGNSTGRRGSRRLGETRCRARTSRPWGKPSASSLCGECRRR